MCSNNSRSFEIENKSEDLNTEIKKLSDTESTPINVSENYYNATQDMSGMNQNVNDPQHEEIRMNPFSLNISTINFDDLNSSGVFRVDPKIETPNTLFQDIKVEKNDLQETEKSKIKIESDENDFDASDKYDLLKIEKTEIKIDKNTFEKNSGQSFLQETVERKIKIDESLFARKSSKYFLLEIEELKKDEKSSDNESEEYEFRKTEDPVIQIDEDDSDSNEKCYILETEIKSDESSSDTDSGECDSQEESTDLDDSDSQNDTTTKEVVNYDKSDSKLSFNQNNLADSDDETIENSEDEEASSSYNAVALSSRMHSEDYEQPQGSGNWSSMASEPSSSTHQEVYEQPLNSGNISSMDSDPSSSFYQSLPGVSDSISRAIRAQNIAERNRRRNKRRAQIRKRKMDDKLRAEQMNKRLRRNRRVDEDPDANLKDSPIICLFYVRGKCLKGNECTFSHAAVPCQKFRVCKFYLRGSCAKGNLYCPYMHKEFPCKYYHFGQSCPHKEGECRFSHGGALNPKLKEMLFKDFDTALHGNNDNNSDY